MRQITRLSIAILCLLLLSSACVFAAASTTTTQFKLYHSVGNPSKTYYCEFWDPDTAQPIRSVTFEEGGRHVFATVMIVYSATVTKANISISFAPLKGTGSTPDTFYYDYTMEVTL
ncbi:MAG: hypothetical protein HUK23_06615, partial [Sphaerochaetaceae bacterium]|nr:hypothetical protein [Sphaerochaetaceae bacterium]